jgi:hypothetical protein
MTGTTAPDVSAPTAPGAGPLRTIATRLTTTAHPVIYEINTWPWLQQLTRAEGRPVDLGSVPAPYWDDLAAIGVDAVWLMGVSRRSPAGIAFALTNPDLTASFTAALPDWQPADVVGSPYCIRDYIVDEQLGGPAGLAAAGPRWPPAGSA